MSNVISLSKTINDVFEDVREVADPGDVVIVVLVKRDLGAAVYATGHDLGDLLISERAIHRSIDKFPEVEDDEM